MRPLADIPALRHPRLNALRMHDLAAAGRLTQLNALNLVPAPVVDSLEPLAGLANLRHLAVWMEEVREGGLAPLARLRGLRSLGWLPTTSPWRSSPGWRWRCRIRRARTGRPSCLPVIPPITG